MIIQTERLVLRPFEKDDVTWYYELVQDKELVERLKSLKVDSADEAVRDVELFSNGDFKNDFYYVITDKNNNVLGIIIAVRITRMTIDVSYFLKAEYRHNGYMHEALAEFGHKVRSVEPLYRLRFEIEKNNIPSLKVAKRFCAIIQDKGDKFMCYI